MRIHRAILALFGRKKYKVKNTRKQGRNDEELKKELEKLMDYLSRSNDSIYAHDSVETLKNIIKDTITKIEQKISVDTKQIAFLILPTESLQEISIDNGWGDEFIAIAEKIEKIV